jgi:hypothetical protein
LDDIFIVLDVNVAAENDVEFCRRVGERSDRPRPLVVGFYMEWSKEIVMKHAKRLINSHLNEVTIVLDLTDKQRKAERELEGEADRRNREELSQDDVARRLTERRSSNIPRSTAATGKRIQPHVMDSTSQRDRESSRAKTGGAGNSEEQQQEEDETGIQQGAADSDKEKRTTSKGERSTQGQPCEDGRGRAGGGAGDRHGCRYGGRRGAAHPANTAGGGGGTGRGGGGGAEARRVPAVIFQTMLILYINAQSVLSKLDKLACIANDLKPDLILLTESWCREEISNSF